MHESLKLEITYGKIAYGIVGFPQTLNHHLAILIILNIIL